MKICSFVFALIFTTNLYATDSVLIYYLPVSTSFTHFIHKDDIDVQTDPYTIVDQLQVLSLVKILNDSLDKFRLGSATKKTNVDARIVIRYYSRGQLEGEYIIAANNSLTVFNGSKYHLRNLKPFYDFLILTCTPETKKQKAFFAFPPA
jgi:hypothetical protein